MDDCGATVNGHGGPENSPSILIVKTNHLPHNTIDLQVAFA